MGFNSDNLWAGSSAWNERLTCTEYRDFEEWLIRNFSESYARDVSRYARRYFHVLVNGDVSVLFRMSKSKRTMVMSSLANLSKFLGIYDEWKGLVKRYGLRWGSRSSLETFISILNFDLEDVKEWLIKVVNGLPREYAVVEGFLALTGLRVGEALNSLKLLSRLSRKNQVDRYLNRDLLMLEHFRFPEIFLRNSKNAYISFISRDLLDIVLNVKLIVEYSALDTKINRLGFRVRNKDLRKMFATMLRNKGLPSEVIDILQGRINSSIFLRFYYKPFLQEIRDKVMKAIAPLEKEMLSHF